MSYFVNTGDGFEIYDTEQEAKHAAQRAIDDWRDCCDPEWPEEAEHVCWGKVFESAIAVEREDTKYIDYELKADLEPAEKEPE